MEAMAPMARRLTTSSPPMYLASSLSMKLVIACEFRIRLKEASIEAERKKESVFFFKLNGGDIAV